MVNKLKKISMLLSTFLLTILIGLPLSVEYTFAEEQQWIEVEEKTTTDVVKPWKITFSKNVDSTSINESNLFVYSEQGEPVELNAPVTSGNQVVFTPKKPYIAGEYTLYLTNIRSVDGDILKNTKFNFAVKAEPVQEDTLYNAIYNALINVEPQLDVSRFTTNSDVAFDTLGQVLEENPEIFYFKYEGSLFWSNGHFELKYHYPKDEIIAKRNQIEQVANNIINKHITPGMSDFEKVKAINDYVVLNTSYDYENYLRNTVPDSSYRIDGVLLNGVAVCDGYAKTIVYLLNKLDIPVLYVSGLGNGGAHAWNKVQVDGKWYNLDVTWNDPVPDRKGQISYKYFLIPDYVLAEDHTWDNSSFPKATDSNYLFFSDMWTFDSEGDYYYFSSRNDDIKLYKIKKDGTGKEKIEDVRANELVVMDGWIYFSNYSYGGYLFKIKTDGTQLTKLNDFHTLNIEKQGNTIKYTDEKGNVYYY